MQVVRENLNPEIKGWCFMKKSNLPLVVTVALLVCAAGGVAARAGSAPNNPTSASAVVTGVVKFEGTAPKPTRIDMSQDPKCAKLHPAGVRYADIVADGNGGLENVVVFVSSGLGDRTFDPPAQPAVIEQKGCLYEPHVVAIRANQQLDVVNNDVTTHNIHPQPANNREWNKSQPPGLRIEETFTREEISIPVKCNMHPWMRSYIAVFKHPYFAVTGKNGSFDLKDLPPGTYTLRAWHETLGTATQTVTIGAAESKQVEFVFKARPGMQ
jgi:plastocyanin